MSMGNVGGTGGASGSGGSGGPPGSYGANLPGTIYRGDSRRPEEIFESGFQPRESGRNVPANQTSLREHVYGERAGPWVSATSNANVADDFAGNNGWVYQIDTPGNAVDVNKALGEKDDSGYGEEEEIAVPFGISNSDIIQAYHIDSLGRPEGPVIKNPNYKPTDDPDPEPPPPNLDPPHDELKK